MLKLSVGIILGSVLTLLCVNIFLQNTYIAISCDPIEDSPEWQTLGDTIKEMITTPYGLHCRRSMIVVKAPGPGKISKETIDFLEKEYK